MHKEKVTIFKPAKSAMQSGVLNRKWRIRFGTDETKYKYHLMGWNGSGDMNQELKLSFETKDQAIAFAKEKNWEYSIVEPEVKKVRKKSYSENFQ